MASLSLVLNHHFTIVSCSLRSCSSDNYCDTRDDDDDGKILTLLLVAMRNVINIMIIEMDVINCQMKLLLIITIMKRAIQTKTLVTALQRANKIFLMHQTVRHYIMKLK